TSRRDGPWATSRSPLPSSRPAASIGSTSENPSAGVSIGRFLLKPGSDGPKSFACLPRCADSQHMKVFLDGEELAVDGGGLGTALAAGTTASEERGRIIVEVWVDGDPAPEADLSDPPDRSPYASEIRLVSAEPKALVRTVLL